MINSEILELKKNPTKEMLLRFGSEVERDLRSLNYELELLQDKIGVQVGYQTTIIDLKNKLK